MQIILILKETLKNKWFGKTIKSIIWKKEKRESKMKLFKLRITNKQNLIIDPCRKRKRKIHWSYLIP